MDALLHRQPKTLWEEFLESPLIFLSTRTYYLGVRRLISPSPSGTPIRIVCISDTHNHHTELPLLPDGDILIHSGDLTQSGTPDELREALRWVANQPHKHKIFIAGNHDKVLDDTPTALRIFLSEFPSLVYLNESSLTITIQSRTLRIYGSPLTPKHGSWPFQYDRTALDGGHWAQIPINTDILITHGPPAHHVDGGRGCEALLDALWRVRPRLHVFGHVHAAKGVESISWSEAQRTYEKICRGDEGWWALLVLIWEVLSIWLWRDIVQTTMVNAACIGGFRDEKRWGASVVDI